MSEALFWQEMQKNIRHLGMFNRIESHATCNGFPDVDYCIDTGYMGKIELKYAVTNEALEKNFIRPSQVRWFKKWGSVGGKGWIFAKFIVKNENHYCLYRGYRAEDLAKTRLIADWISLSNFSWHGEMDWKHFIKVITTG